MTRLSDVGGKGGGVQRGVGEMEGGVEGEGEGEGVTIGEAVSAGTSVVVTSVPTIAGSTVLMSGCSGVIVGRRERGRAAEVLLVTRGDITAMEVVVD